MNKNIIIKNIKLPEIKGNTLIFGTLEGIFGNLNENGNISNTDNDSYCSALYNMKVLTNTIINKHKIIFVSTKKNM